MQYLDQRYTIASPGKKKLDSFHLEGIKIYTDIFRTSAVESLHIEACDMPLELRRTGIRFLYNLRTTPHITEFLNTLNDRRTKTMKKTKEQPKQN